jgi:hypothetical protein
MSLMAILTRLKAKDLREETGRLIAARKKDFRLSVYAGQKEDAATRVAATLLRIS